MSDMVVVLSADMCAANLVVKSLGTLLTVNVARAMRGAA